MYVSQLSALEVLRKVWSRQQLKKSAETRDRTRASQENHLLQFLTATARNGRWRSALQGSRGARWQDWDDTALMLTTLKTLEWSATWSKICSAELYFPHDNIVCSLLCDERKKPNEPSVCHRLVSIW